MAGGIAFCMVLAVAWMLRERNRYLNAEMGNVFRAWLVDNLPHVLDDDHATRAARSAASVLLRCAYDHKELQKLSRADIPEGEAFISAESYGAHAALISAAIRHAALLAAFETPRMGNAIRELASEGPAPTPGHAPAPDWAEGIVEAFSGFGFGSVLNRRLESGVAQLP
jgi:hypothetical protein